MYAPPGPDRRSKMTTLKWAISSDQHFPWHNPKHIELWFKVLKYMKPDAVDYLGDTSDQACFSRWAEGSSTKDFINKVKETDVEKMYSFVESEERPAMEFYARTREMLPNADLFVALGNHDVRIFDYVDKKIPELIEAATPENMWRLDSLGYDYIYYNDLPKRRFGDLHVHHGMAVSKHAGESVKADVENFGVSIMRGHSHRMGSFYRTYELRNETVRGYELGHMTDVKSEGMSYTNSHNWQSGFAVALVNGDDVHVQLIQIINNSCVVNGRLFVV
jgi:hypothetical protein